MSTSTFDSTLANLGIGRSGTAATPTVQTQAASQTLGQADFLKLMTAQLKSQDPFNPVDNTQMVAQMAQFSSVAGISQMNSTLSSIADKLGATSTSDALSYVGKNVLTAGNVAYGRSSGGIQGAVQLGADASDVTVAISDANGNLLKTMSLGFIIREDEAAIWRGPMVQSALMQFLTQVNWAPLDVLVLDMPPGTGDAQLTITQRVALTGAVIVSTPQDIALIDARKAIAMFQKVKVPILGLVENMSMFVCPGCGEQHPIFGHGGAKDTATALDAPFLGEIPLVPKIRELSDSGTPVVVTEPDGPEAAAFHAVAAKVAAALETPHRPAPKIVLE